MFYIKYFTWVFFYFLGFFFFKLRIFYCRLTHTPIISSYFDYENMSIFWLYFLFFFYKPNNYLRKIPLSRKDFIKLLNLRLSSSLYPFYLTHYSDYIFFQKKGMPLNFNGFKKFFKLFKLCVQSSRFFDSFFGKDLFFLKFIFFKRIFFKKFFILFFLATFFLKKSFKRKFKKIIFNDFYVFYCLSILKYSNSRNCFFKKFSPFSLKGIYAVLVEKKKPVSTFHEDDEEEQFFRKLFGEIYFIKMLRTLTKYKKVWQDIYINIYIINNALPRFFDKIPFFKNTKYLINHPIFFKNSYKEFVNYFWPVKFENSNFNKFIDLNFNKNNIVLFLRKNKIFNKGRYSRNRQLYRTGVYMCLWINVIFVYFYLFSFYRFTFNFGFMWVGIGVFLISMTFARAARYRFYNFKNFINELYNFFCWLGYFFNNIYILLKFFLEKRLFKLINFFKYRNI